MASKPRRRIDPKKKPGTYWYGRDWLSDSAVQSCSYAAKGLWMDLLCHALQREPQGVLPGSPSDVARILGVPDAVVMDTADRIYGPLLDELESRGVFSRGADVDSRLDPRAIVNRRMFREWVRVRETTESKRRAALVRWYGDKGMQTHAEACTNDALDPCTANARSNSARVNDARGYQNKSMHNACSTKCTGDAYPNLTDPIDKIDHLKKPRSLTDTARGGDPKSVGAILDSASDSAGEFTAGLMRRISEVSEDGPMWISWWGKVVAVMARTEGLGELEGIVRYAEDCQNERTRALKGLGALKQPGAYMASRILKYANERRISLPEMPRSRSTSNG